MEKPYLNIKELSIVLGQGRRYAERVMKDLRKIAKEKTIIYQKVVEIY